MYYNARILTVLNRELKKDILDRKTKGWVCVSTRTVNGCIEHMMHVPNGKSISTVEALHGALRASCGAEIELDDHGGIIIIRVCPQKMDRLITFDEKMLKDLKPFHILLGYDRKGNQVVYNWNPHPHLIIAGITGMGKTDLIRLIIYTLMYQFGKNIEICIVDMKVASFMPFEDLENVSIGIDFEDAETMIDATAKEVIERMYTVHLRRNRDVFKNMNKRILIIDEAADLSPSAYKEKEMKKRAQKIEANLLQIARKGREAGVHLIYATQYPTADVIDKGIKFNCGARIGFHVNSHVQSSVILDETGAEDLPPYAGRAIFKDIGYTTMQIPYVGNDDAWNQLLMPLKTEVINAGHSHRTKLQRTVYDVSEQSTDSNNKAIGNGYNKPESKQESIINIKAIGTTGISKVETSGYGKVLAIDNKRQEIPKRYSDEVE